MIRVPHLGDSDVGVLLPHKVNVLVGQVLAHDESPVVALGVVPAEPVPEESVQQSHAGLSAETICLEETVRLGFVQGSSGGPAVELSAIVNVGLSHALERGGPEPASDVVRLEPRLVTPVHLLVAEPAAGPDLPDVGFLHGAAHEVLLRLALEAHQVHATLPAVVPGGEPVPAGVPQHRLVRVPGEPVGLTAELGLSRLILSIGTKVCVREADFPVTAGVHLGAYRILSSVPSDPVVVELISVVGASVVPIIVPVVALSRGHRQHHQQY